MSYRTKVIILDEHLQVLASANGGQASLPEVEVESGRAGIALYRAIRTHLSLETFSLVLPQASSNGLNVFCLQSPVLNLPSGLCWADPANLADDSLAAVLQEVALSCDSFGGLRWYASIQAWLENQLNGLGQSVVTLEQWNGRVGGVLLRVIGSGPDLWFKAVSDFNSREMRIAELLAVRHPQHFPRILATLPEWNAFLLEHVEGVELYETESLETWRATATLLAKVQIGWAGAGDSLLEAGAADLRATTLIGKIPEFLEHAHEAMSRQQKSLPRRLSRTDLHELGSSLYTLSENVAALSIPDGLANADFSPHNTLITKRGPVFIDWAEACVSLPLIAGEYLWNRMVVETPDRVGWQDTLRRTYLDCWADAYGAEQVATAAELLPTFAIFAVAMFYHQRECHGESPYDSYLRSLTRKLELTLQTLSRANYVHQN
jgi:hypothetical protein